MINIKQLQTDGYIMTADGEAVELPSEFLGVLPTYCACGTELEISEALTQVACPNPHCISKVTQRLASMLAYIGVKDIGEALCREFFVRIPVYNPYIVFMLQPTDASRFAGSKITPRVLESLCSQLSTRRDYTLAEFIKIGFLPGIQDSSFKLFSGYNSLTDFYTDFEQGGANFVAAKLGKPAASVTVSNACVTLTTFKKDLLQGEHLVNIKSVAKTVNICISTAVGAPFTSKSEYVKHLQDTYGSIQFNWLNSVTNSCDYLILADKTATTKKAVAARKKGIPIYSGAEFEELVKKNQI